MITGTTILGMAFWLWHLKDGSTGQCFQGVPT
jgi:hypothetical protein